ncbi:phage tail assembly chaperone [Paenibacillus phocaensis]|uniref:phage tail assembly chaperone n=1 Tax=Paenibacillus phocaensis TaxID=1776378 RepID=UPI000839D6F9|nr:XkdN-like protein [Paenibacillus phocaensis]
MSTLQDFLNSNPVDGLTAEVVVSSRFKGPDGNLLKFKIKAMSGPEFEDIRKRSTTILKKGKVEFNAQRFNNTCVINNTLEPDFKDAESIKKLGCTSPEEYLNKVLLPGEIATLAEHIQKLSGFETDMEELVNEAKN